MATPSSSKKTCTSSYHYEFLRYTVQLDLSEPEANRCNCSLCLKSGFTGVRSAIEDFQLTSPASINDLADYQFGSKIMHHYFCPSCGVRCMFKGTDAENGQDFFSINILTLDQNVDVDLTRFKISYWDGKSNNWQLGPRDQPYPGGFVSDEHTIRRSPNPSNEPSVVL
jgi:hypothetical protein